MSGPLNSNHLDLLRSAQRSLNEALPLIDRAEACGLDCQEYRQGHAALSDRVARYITHFFPGQIVGQGAGPVRHDGG